MGWEASWERSCIYLVVGIQVLGHLRGSQLLLRKLNVTFKGKGLLFLSLLPSDRLQGFLVNLVLAVDDLFHLEVKSDHFFSFFFLV